MPEKRIAQTRSEYSQWFVVVVAIFVTCLITAGTEVSTSHASVRGV